MTFYLTARIFRVCILPPKKEVLADDDPKLAKSSACQTPAPFIKFNLVILALT